MIRSCMLYLVGPQGVIKNWSIEKGDFHNNKESLIYPFFRGTTTDGQEISILVGPSHTLLIEEARQNEEAGREEHPSYYRRTNFGGSP